MDLRIRIAARRARLHIIHAFAIAFSACSGLAIGAELVVDTSVDAFHYTGGCTLRDAVENVTSRNQDGSRNCIAGTGNDSIAFKPGITAIALDPTLGEIEIGEDVQLYLYGREATPVELSGQGATRIARITGSKTQVRMANLNFRYGAVTGSGRGGAVYIEKPLSVSFWDVRFDVNSAAMGGGAIAIDGAATSVSMLDVVFYQNSSMGDENGDNGYGGAIDINIGGGTTVMLLNPSFLYNQARSGGGAIRCAGGDATSMLAVTGGINGKPLGTFQGNIAWAPNADVFGPFGGGAILNACAMRVLSTYFYNNFAVGKGPAIYHRSGGNFAFIENSSFDKNGMLAEPGLEGNGIGGAIATEGALDVERSSFTNNTGWQGGALHVRDTQINDVTVSNSTMLDNTAVGGGAAIYLRGAVNAKFWNNTIAGNVGADSVHFDQPSSGSAIDWKNSILVSEGPNCGGDLHTVDGGPNNLQNDIGGAGTCPFQNGLPVGVAGLGGIEVAPYYPFTVYVPISANDGAAGAGRPDICSQLTVDQIAAPRNAARCSLGAVEP